MKKCGLILARFQPIHLGHLELIDSAVTVNDVILILVGSADKNNLRNPIPIDFRLKLVEETLKEKYKDNNNILIRVATVDEPYINDEEFKDLPEGTKIVKVIPLQDLSDESHNDTDWGWYLHANVAKHINTPYFTMYYSDGFELIMSWFPSFIRNKFISFVLFAREATLDNLSATKVRNYIIKKNDTALKKSVPTCVFENRNIIRHMIKQVIKENKKEKN